LRIISLKKIKGFIKDHSGTVFNIANNKYRLIARVNYESRNVFVLHILTHKSYDKMDCNK